MSVHGDPVDQRARFEEQAILAAAGDLEAMGIDEDYIKALDLAIKEQARNQGFVTTLLGRKRQIPELTARNPTLRAAGERMAINMPIQGTAADIVKIATRIQTRNASSQLTPCLNVSAELDRTAASTIVDSFTV